MLVGGVQYGLYIYELQSFDDARSTCMKYGGDLASFDSLAEWNAVAALLDVSKGVGVGLTIRSGLCF